MHRFPNPGSTIENFIAVYTAAIERLGDEIIDLDDMVGAVVAANLATSSGYMGKEAVRRSTRDDRSLDSLYNLLKMYAELFRVLGWMHSTATSSLNYTFTQLGRKLLLGSADYVPLFRECALGMVYPNRILKVKGKYELRPFASILQTMLQAGGHLSRDEMILGPLNSESDRDPHAAGSLAQSVRKLRKSGSAVATALAHLARKRKIQVNTLHNYTRWPLAVLKYCGWTRESIAAYGDGSRYKTWSLTDEGIVAANRIGSLVDLRLDQVEQLPRDEMVAITLNTHYAMLGRAGFDLATVTAVLEATRPLVIVALRRLNLPTDRDLLFSPFQTLSAAEIALAFPSASSSGEALARRGEERDTRDPVVETKRKARPAGPVGRGSHDHLFVAPVLVNPLSIDVASIGVPTVYPGASVVKAELVALFESHRTAKLVAKAFAAIHLGDSKAVFYPLITHLFQLLGYRCEQSRYGVNNQRWDACVWIGEDAIPVEIKSPTEELYLSTKSLRQAVENKVILLARGGLRTSFDLPSLIIGFRVPNERGDLSMLIDDIYKAYRLRVGVIDLEGLVTLAVRSITQNVILDPKQLSSLRGFLNV